MVGVATGALMNVQVHPRLHGQRLIELAHELAVEAADPLARDRRQLVDQVRTPAEVER